MRLIRPGLAGDEGEGIRRFLYSVNVLALLAGNVLAFPLRALRHQLPHYVGIYEPRTGVQILVLGQLLRVASLVAAGGLFYLMY